MVYCLIPREPEYSKATTVFFATSRSRAKLQECAYAVLMFWIGARILPFGRAFRPTPLPSGPRLLTNRGQAGTQPGSPAVRATTRYAGGFWMTLNVTLPKVRS